jgi:hypothetical protein
LKGNLTHVVIGVYPSSLLEKVDESLMQVSQPLKKIGNSRGKGVVRFHHLNDRFDQPQAVELSLKADLNVVPGGAFLILG